MGEMYYSGVQGRHVHLCTVTSTRRWRDLFRERYWIRCWECDYREGPWESAGVAWMVACARMIA